MEEETMTEATQSWIEMLRKFGNDLNLPKVDVDKLIEVHRKNLDALEQSAQVASAGAKSLADKQREIIESAFSEAAAMARDFKPTGNPQEILTKQTEFAKKAFDITVQHTRDIAQLATQTTTDATKIIRDRLRESLTELGDSLRRAQG
jgi:phasin family protein